MAKLVVDYNRLFSFCFFQKMKSVIAESDTILSNSKESPVQTFEDLIKLSLLDELKKQVNQEKYLISVWKVLNRFNFFCNSSLLDINLTLVNLVSKFNRSRAEVPPLKKFKDFSHWL